MQRKSTTVPIILTVILIVSLCCLAICLVIFASGAALLNWWDFAMPTPMVIEPPTPNIIGPTPGKITPEEIIPTPEPTPHSANNLGSDETLRTLQEMIVPINDPIDLAERLGGKQDIPESLPDPNAPYAVGESQNFWVTNVDTNENFQITATLHYLGEHVYIWIENGVSFDTSDLNALGDTFDNEIYPTNRDFFGSEWSPGVDGDPRIYIVYASGLGRSLAGYYSSADQLHPNAHEYSNAHEMFLINSDNVYLWEDYIYGTLAHEFQHMIHWYRDKNEETWLNEGFSMLAEFINGFDPGGFEYSYIRNPDLQLTDWGQEVGNNGPHYGASMLFTTYFLDRFGDDATKALVAHDKNGMESIDIVLEEMAIRDPITGESITSEDVFSDWAVANLLGDGSVADGRYHYSIYPDAPLAAPGTIFPTCPSMPNAFDVFQFGVDYIEVTCPGDYTLNFQGNTFTSILPIYPFSGDYFFWSNMGDHSNMSLERDFDFRGVSGPIELSYQTWYDLEEDYDYVFVSASTDSENWEILHTTSCTLENPSGNSYGCGLNGTSNGWQQELVDLTPFADQEVTLRFDYVTDAAVNGLGMIIDDIQVDAIGYFADFEEDDGGWGGEGFARIQNMLPQSFRFSMITLGDEVLVTPLNLDENNHTSVDISIGEDVESILLVVSGTTPFTRQKADYQITITGND